jgi:DNA polymerase III, beta subunit
MVKKLIFALSFSNYVHAMRFIVTSNDLLQQLLTVAKAISSKSVAAIPVLENILFELKGNALTLTASDQSNRLTSVLEVQNQSGDGTFAVRSNIIIDALKELPDQPIEMEVEEEAHKATVTYSNGIYTFLTSSADVYPEPIKLEGDVRTVELPAQSLLRGLERTSFAASDDDRRPIMTGVYLDFFADKLVFVASDGRILVRYTDTNIKNDAPAAICLPARVCALLTRGLLAKEVAPIRVSFDDRNVVFQMKSGTLTARLLEGKYPNYNSVIPIESLHNITVDKDLLFFASKRVSLFSNKASSLVIFEFSEGNIHITGQDLELSIAAEETIPCSGQTPGTKVRIGFDFNYLQRLLQGIPSEQILISLTDQTRAGVITPIQSEEGIEICSLIIPMKLIGE